MILQLGGARERGELVHAVPLECRDGGSPMRQVEWRCREIVVLGC